MLEYLGGIINNDVAFFVLLRMVFFQLSSTISCIPRLSYRVNKQGMKVGDSLQDSVGIFVVL